MNQQSVVKTMERVLDQGKRFDEEMTKLAEQEVNPAMLANGEDQEDEGKQPTKAQRRK
jgi:ferritin-like metal-binding protein YciE